MVDKPSIRRRFLRAVGLYVAVPYLAVVGIFAGLQRQLLYPGTVCEQITSADYGSSPSVCRDVVIDRDDGMQLRGWWIQDGAGSAESIEAAAEIGSESTSASAERVLVMYFPGNSGNRFERRRDLEDVVRAGVDLLIFDYRGYGDNPGSPSEGAIHADARRAWEYAVTSLGYRPERVVLFGESLGGAVAVQLAASLCDESTSPRGLIVTSTFASVGETVSELYPWFPFRYVLLDRYESAAAIGRVTCPITVIHGTEDEFVLIEQARGLFEAAPATSSAGVAREFVTVEGMRHNALPVDVLRRAIRERAGLVDE